MENMDDALNALRRETEESLPIAADEERTWFVAIGGEQMGPLGVSELRHYWRRRDLDEDSLAWKQGMGDWQAIADIPELAFLIQELPQTTGPVQSMKASESSHEASDVMDGALQPVTLSNGSADDSLAWQPSAATSLSDLLAREKANGDQSVEAEQPKATEPANVLGDMPQVEATVDPFAPKGVQTRGDELGSTQFQLPSAPVSKRREGSGNGLWLIASALVVMVGVGAAAFALGWIQLGGPVVSKTTSQTASVAEGAQEDGAKSTADSAAASSPETPNQAAEASALKKKKAGPSKDSAARSAKTKKAERKKSEKKKAKAKDRANAKPAKKEDGGFDPFGGGAPQKSVQIEQWSKNTIISQFRKNAGSLKNCVQEVQKRGTLAPGSYKVLVDWQALPNGKSRGLVTGPGPIMSTSLPGCIARKMQAWKLPTSTKGFNVQRFPYPISIR